MPRPADRFFPEAALARALNECPFCKVKVDVNTLRDELSKREFRISGLCQTCQDDMFGGSNPKVAGPQR